MTFLMGIGLVFFGAVVISVVMGFRVRKDYCACGRYVMLQTSMTEYQGNTPCLVHERLRCYPFLEEVV